MRIVTKRWDVLIPLSIMIVGILAYSNSFSGVFIFDDHVVITGNHEISHFDKVTSVNVMNH